MTLRREIMPGVERLLRAHRLGEHAVDAEPDADVLLLRLDVDVGRTLLDGRRDDPVDRLDDRRLVCAELVLVERLLLVSRGLLEELLGGAVELLEARRCSSSISSGRTTRTSSSRPRRRAEVVQRDDVGRVGHRDRHRLAVARDRDRLVAADQRMRDEVPGLLVDRCTSPRSSTYAYPSRRARRASCLARRPARGQGSAPDGVSAELGRRPSHSFPSTDSLRCRPWPAGDDPGRSGCAGGPERGRLGGKRPNRRGVWLIDVAVGTFGTSWTQETSPVQRVDRSERPGWDVLQRAGITPSRSATVIATYPRRWLTSSQVKPSRPHRRAPARCCDRGRLATGRAPSVGPTVELDHEPVVRVREVEPDASSARERPVLALRARQSVVLE